MLWLRRKTEQIANKAIVSAALAQANISNTWQDAAGLGSPKKRLGDPIWEDVNADRPNSNTISNLCVFVIYSSEPSCSTLSYLQALKDAGFKILAVNNMRTSKEFLATLKPLCWKIYNRVNIGRDFGAYKDSILQLFEDGHLQRCSFFCMANDSMQFVPGRNGEDFTTQIRRFINEDSGALFSHESHQICKHYQSYFQILDRDVVNSSNFYSFWSNYRPLSHREHCIYNGELELSKRIYNHIHKARVLYTTEALLGALKYNENAHSITVDKILGSMPSIAKTMLNKNKRIYALDQLTAAALEKKPIDALIEHHLSELIEYSNPSHIAAFLYPIYLKCPLIKHDICLAGSFSTGKALLLFHEVLHLAGVEATERDKRSEEFRALVTSKGIPIDYKNKPIQKAIKGIVDGFQYA